MHLLVSITTYHQMAKFLQYATTLSNLIEYELKATVLANHIVLS